MSCRWPCCRRRGCWRWRCTAACRFTATARGLPSAWAQAEFSGLAADPTAIATLGLLLLLRGPRGPLRAMWLLPLGWCLLSAATLWTLGSMQGGVLLVAAWLAGAAARRG
jgi:hypothetical protein